MVDYTRGQATLNHGMLWSWEIAIRSLGKLRPSESALLLACLAVAQFAVVFVLNLHWPVPSILAFWLPPVGVLYWIGRRRSEYAHRKLRRNGGENLCLDCGYLVSEPGASIEAITTCPECGSLLKDHSHRANVATADAFIFSELEFAMTDTQAQEWLTVAASRIGWLGTHRFQASIGALLGVALVMALMLNVVDLWIDIPTSSRLLVISFICGVGMAVFYVVELTWHRRMSVALATLRIERVNPSIASG